MKTMIRAAIAALALSAAPALAADAIVDIPEPPAVVDVAVPFTWTGAYVGAQLGYLDAVDDDNPIDGVRRDVDIDGFIGGVHAGYNYQFASGLVLGVYADVDFTMADVDLEASPAGANNIINDVGEANFIARGLAKVGYGFGRALVYGQGGVAYVDASLDGVLGDFGDIDSFGYAVGAGVDYAVTENIVVGADYLFHNFSDFEDTGGLDTSSIDLDAHTVRAKFSYKF